MILTYSSVSLQFYKLFCMFPLRNGFYFDYVLITCQPTDNYSHTKFILYLLLKNITLHGSSFNARDNCALQWLHATDWPALPATSLQFISHRLTLKHFNQMPELSIIYSTRLALPGCNCCNAILNLFALWRGHGPKAQQELSSCPFGHLTIWLFGQLAIAGICSWLQLMDFICGCCCQQLVAW